MKRMKKLLYVLMMFSFLTASLLPAAMASYEGEERVVIGADLTEDQKAEVYDMLGIDVGAVTEMSVTNDEEREYLEGVVSESTIGTRAISCVYIKILAEDKGLDVSTTNINWCTDEIYQNALMTAGIYDAEVIVAAPFEVSGTAALTGIYKAYEDITGETLSEDAKIVATEELVTTSELADEIGEADATEIVNELKKILDQTSEMKDEELRTEILNIAEQANVELTDDQISQLISLVRNLEKMDTSELIEKVKSIQDTVKSWSEIGEKVSSFFEDVKSFFASVAEFFNNLFGKST